MDTLHLVLLYDAIHRDMPSHSLKNAVKYFKVASPERTYVKGDDITNVFDADTETLREIVSEDMTFTHMSGMVQSREEYFADIADGNLNYFTIGIDKPVIKVDGDSASITFTSVLNANAYGARGTFRMKGTHHYKKRDGEWIAVNE